MKHLLIRLAALGACTVLLLLFVVEIKPQHGNQMEPSVRDGDLVITLKIPASYHTGALCAYRKPDGKISLGRIAAMPGDKVDFSPDGTLLINGLEESGAVREKGAEETAAAGEGITCPYTVPDKSYFLLNDLREEGGDSRTFGAVNKEDMRGQAFWLFRRRSF